MNNSTQAVESQGSINYFNFIVPSVSTPRTEGHIASEKLLPILQRRAGIEGYHALFDMEERKTFESYQGKARPAMGWVVFDFDSNNLSDCQTDVLKLWTSLKLHQNFARIFFSGSKGFHLYIREEYFNVPHDEKCAITYRALGQKLKLIAPTLDTSIIQANRLFRIPNSKHPKTGCYKVELTHEQMTSWTIEQFKAFSKSPREFNLKDYKLPENKAQIEEAPATVGPVVWGTENVIDDDTKSFSNFKDKVCIKKMWEGTHAVGERHSIALALIADAFETGVSKSDLEPRLHGWATRQGILDRWESDLLRAIEEQYDGRRNYSFGCYSPTKQSHCSGTCTLYPRLKKELRAVVHDIPPKVQKLMDENEMPSHKEHAVELVRGFNGNIIKQDRDIFLFKNTHWVEAEQNEIDALKKELHKKIGERQRIDVLEKAFKMFLLHVPAVPANVSMFQPNPYAANFRNGTLWVTRTQGLFQLTFKPHSREDYLTTCIDAAYSTERGNTNSRFSELLTHLLSSDPEREHKLLALKQVAGAMLLPTFPQIFFLLGESGSGKSTFALTFYHALGGAKYSSTVQPCDMKGFELEGMINKTVNLHTDIDENKPIPDSILKETADRRPKQVNRKGKKVVQAFLPAVHVYCANSMPPTSVKNQNVYNRRATIIKLDNVVGSGVEIKHFEELIVKAGKQALIEFALEGVESLVASGGVFMKSDSSKFLTKAWQEMSSDSLTDFLDAVGSGEASITLDAAGQLNRTRVFKAYDAWSIEAGYREVKLKSAQFYRELMARGFKGKMVRGDRVFEGFSEGLEQNSHPSGNNARI